MTPIAGLVRAATALSWKSAWAATSVILTTETVVMDRVNGQRMAARCHRNWHMCAQEVFGAGAVSSFAGAACAGPTAVVCCDRACAGSSCEWPAEGTSASEG
eukprot:scaffold9752_cov103-Isochrysis_galbana.AAC.4